VAAFCNTVRTPGGGSHLDRCGEGICRKALADRASRIRDLGPGQRRRWPGEAQGFRGGGPALAVDHSGTRCGMGLPSQDRGCPSALQPWNVAMAPGRGRGGGHHLGRQTRQTVTRCRCGPSWRRGGRQGAAQQRRGCQGPVPGGVRKAKGPGGRNLSAARHKLLPSRGGPGRGFGCRVVPVRGRLGAGGTIKAARPERHLPGRPFPLKG